MRYSGSRTPRQFCVLFCLWLGSQCAAFGQSAPGIAIHIGGVQGELLDNAHASLSLQRRKTDPLLTPELIRSLHQRATEEIRRALQPFGYYRPSIKSTLTAPATADAAWQADYSIVPNDAIILHRLDLALLGAGSGDPELMRLRETFPLSEGDVLDHRGYTQGKASLLRKARRLGYLDAHFLTRRIEIDPRAYRAAIVLHLKTGKQYRFGAVSFVQSGFDTDYLKSFVPFASGDAFEHDALVELRRALGASGHFQQVEIKRLPIDVADSTLIPIEVRLTPFKPNRYRTRFGWGTDTGIGLHFDWTRRHLWDTGHQVTFGTVLVQKRKKLVADLNYGIPLDPLRRTRIELFARHQGKELSYEDIDLDEGGSTRILNNTLGVRYPGPTRSLGPLAMEEKISLTFLSESYDVFEVLFGHQSPFVQELIETALGEDREILSPSFLALVPGISWTHRARNDVLYPTRGDYLRFSLKGALKGMGSNISFWQARLRGAFIRPLIASDRLILRGDFGYSAADSIDVLGANFNQMPELYEFRTGGDRSVRGYGYETLLPQDAVTGGKHLLVASVEYEKEIIDKWSAAVFLDAGNAFNEFSEMDIKLGTGVGARWRSPVGLVRVDFGLPLSDSDGGFQIHFTIGPEF